MPIIFIYFFIFLEQIKPEKKKSYNLFTSNIAGFIDAYSQSIFFGFSFNISIASGFGFFDK